MRFDVFFPYQLAKVDDYDWLYIDGAQAAFPDLRVLHWEDTTGTIEFTDQTQPPQEILSLSPYQSLVDMWNARNTPPPPPTDQETRDKTVAEYRSLFTGYLNTAAKTGNSLFSNLTDAMCYASTTNDLQTVAISLVNWSAGVRIQAETSFQGILDGSINPIPTYQSIEDSLTDYSPPP